MKPKIKLNKRFIITDAIQAMPLAVVINQFLADDVGSENTRRSYEHSLLRFCKWLAVKTKQDVRSLQVADVTKSLVIDFQNELLEELSPRSVFIRVASIKSLLGFCERTFNIRVPRIDIKISGANDSEFIGLTKEQAARLRNYAISKLNDRDEFIVKALISSGLRRDELRRLTIGQIDPDITWINRLRRKGNKIKDVAIGTEFRHAIIKYYWWREQFPMKKGDPLVVSLKGVGPLNPKTIYRIVHNACVAVGVPTELAHPHTLRHTYADELLELASKFTKNASRQLLFVKDQLGHSSTATTEQYVRNKKRDLYNLVNYEHESED